jgi:hypothetical protein
VSRALPSPARDSFACNYFLKARSGLFLSDDVPAAMNELCEAAAKWLKATGMPALPLSAAASSQLIIIRKPLFSFFCPSRIFPSSICPGSTALEHRGRAVGGERRRLAS